MKRIIALLLVFVLMLSGVSAFAEGSSDEKMMKALLDTLGKNDYRITYEYLQEGRTIYKGASGKHVKGLQKALDAFGRDITADGKAGSGTFKALNKVRKAYGMQETSRVNADDYKQLLVRLLVYKDGDAAYDLLVRDTSYLSYGEYQYMRGCGMTLRGKYYSAKKYFENSYWGDYRQRAADCAKTWPEDGLLWKDKSIGGGVKFKIKVKDQSYNVGEVFKVYRKDTKKHVATLFIGANGSATTYLPSGTYYIKSALGWSDEWYGKKELFGSDVEYNRLLIDGKKTFTIHSNYAWYTLTCSR